MPRLLDLFCGGGGAAMGYHMAGYEVVGVDLSPQPGYPFEFVQADALGYLADHGGEFDAIHASPPCHAYSISRNATRKQYPDKAYPMLVGPTRDALLSLRVPWVIENVVGAPLIDPIRLCGSMFGLQADDWYSGQRLQLRRHRLFESSVPIMPPGPCAHVPGMVVGGVYGGAWSKNSRVDGSVKRSGGYTPPLSVQKVLMGIDWLTSSRLNQAIPPAYTEWIGRQMIAWSEDHP